MAGVSRDELLDLVRDSPYAVAALDLASMRLLVGSSPGMRVLGARRGLDGASVFDFVVDRETASRALQTVRDGVVDAFQVSQGARRTDGSIAAGTVCVRAVDDRMPRELAVVAFTSRPAVEEDDSSRVDGRPTPTVGTLDHRQHITGISSDVMSLLGFTPEQCIGQLVGEFVHPDDVDALRTVVDAAVRADASVGNEIRLLAADGSWRRLHVTVTPVDASAPLAFAATPVEGEQGTRSYAQRIADLEGHLARIAHEVEAAGFLRDGAPLLDFERVPQLGQLTSKQWDILVRLLRGERVPAIARAMFLNEGTVRNYLSAMYRTFDVHSQAELIEKVRPSAFEPI